MSSLLIDNPINVIGGGGISLSTPSDFIRLIVLSIVPGMVSLGVWANVRFAVTHWVDSLLSEGCCILWVESRVRAFFIDDPVDVIGSGGVSLFAPCDFIGLVMLIIVP